MTARKPLIRERHLYKKPERKHARKIRSIFSGLFVFFFVGGWWMQSAQAQSAGGFAQNLLPIDRWGRFVRPNVDFGPGDVLSSVVQYGPTGGVGIGIMNAVNAAISNFFYAVTNTLWDITFNIISLGFNVNIASRAGNTANRVAAILGDLFFRTGLVWMILIFAIAYIFYMVFKGASTSVIRIALATLMPLGLLFFTSNRAVQQEAIQVKIENGTASSGDINTYNSIVGSPKWFLDQGIRLSNMPFAISSSRVPNLSGNATPGRATAELSGSNDPFSSLAATNYYGKDPSWRNYSTCADYVQQIHNAVIADPTSKFPNRVTEARVRSSVSSIWERAVLVPWINSEFGSGNDFGKAVFCHKLETDADIPIGDRWKLFAAAWPGAVERPPGGVNVGDDVSIGQIKRLVELIFNEGDDQVQALLDNNDLKDDILTCLNDATAFAGISGFAYRQTAGRLVSAVLGGDCVDKIGELIEQITERGKQLIENGQIPRETFNLLCDVVDKRIDLCPAAGIGRDRTGSQYTPSEKVFHVNNKCRPADIAGSISTISPRPSYQCQDGEGNDVSVGMLPERLLAQISQRSREGMRENLVAFAWCRWDKNTRSLYPVKKDGIAPSQAFDRNFASDNPFTLVWDRGGSSNGVRSEVGLNETQACNQWWDFGNFNPKDRQLSGGMFAFNPVQIGTATTANGHNSAEVANFLYSMNGGGIGGGIAGVVSSLITMIVAIIYFFSLGAMAFAVLLAQIQLVLVFAMLPAFLLVGAFPHPKTKGVIKVMLKMMATGLFAKAAAVLLLSFFILITILLTALVEGALAGFQVRGTFGSVWSAIVPLFVIFALKKIPGVRNMMTFRGAFRSAKQRMKLSTTGGLMNPNTQGGFGRQLRAYGRSFGNSMNNLSPHSGMAAGHRMRNRLASAVGSIRGQGAAGAVAGIAGANLPNVGAAGAGPNGPPPPPPSGGGGAAAGAPGGKGGQGGQGGQGGRGGPGGRTLVNPSGVPIGTGAAAAAGAALPAPTTAGVIFNPQGKAIDPKTGQPLPAPPAPPLIIPGDPENKGHAASPKGIIISNAHQYPKQGRQGDGLGPTQGDVDRRKQEAEQLKLSTRSSVGQAEDKTTPALEVVNGFKRNENKAKDLVPEQSVLPGAPGPDHAKDSAAMYGDLVGPKSQEDAAKTDWKPGEKEEVRFPVDSTDSYATPYGTMNRASVGEHELYLPDGMTYIPPVENSTAEENQTFVNSEGIETPIETHTPEYGYAPGYYPGGFTGNVSLGGGRSFNAEPTWNTSGQTWKDQWEQDKHRAQQDKFKDISEAYRMQRDNEHEIFKNEMAQRRQKAEEERQLFMQQRNERNDEYRKDKESRDSRPIPSRNGGSSSLDGIPQPGKGGSTL